MELRQLRYFVKVAELLSFSEAARVLCVTQSTLSQQIKQLETELGTALFERTSHSVALTEAGEGILPNARQALYEAGLCAERINDLNSMTSGTLNIGVTYTFGPIATEALLEFMKLHPKVKLNIFYKSVDELITMLREREIDMALAFKSAEPVEGIQSHILFQNYLAAVVNPYHPLASQDKVSLSDLEHYDMALPSKGMQARKALDRTVTPHCNLRVRMELNSVTLLLHLIERTSMVTVLAEATIHNAAGVKAIRLDIPDYELAGCIHTLKDSYRKRSMQEFVRLLNNSIAVRNRQTAWL